MDPEPILREGGNAPSGLSEEATFIATLLIVDDEELNHERIALATLNQGVGHHFRILSAGTTASALKILSSEPVHVMLLDKNLGQADDDGIASIPRFLNAQPHLEILILTGSQLTSDAVDAMRLGAHDYLQKDYPDSLLVEKLVRAERASKRKRVLSRLEQNPALRGKSIRLGGKSKLFQRILENTKRVAISDRPVILLGESGLGKTALAQVIHDQRATELSRQSNRFVALNLKAISPQTISSELFGHERGAFTGAAQMKQGLIELAHQGTLFLDEVAEIPLDVQSLLLKVIEEKKFYRVGGTRELSSSFKLVCATHRDLPSMVKAGTFRYDLYQRISSLIVRIPPLEERREDIPEIIRALLPRACAESRVKELDLEDLPKDFIELLTHRVPEGNIRGIDHALSRLLIYTPTDRLGQKYFRDWHLIPELSDFIGELPEPKPRLADRPGSINWSMLSFSHWDVLGRGFPGLGRLLECVESQVLKEAKRKFKTSKEVARALGISESSVSLKLKAMRYADEGKTPELDVPIRAPGASALEGVK